MNVRAPFAAAAVALAALLPVLQLHAAPNPADAPMIGEAYYKCDQPQLLEGGIYGKGPFHRFGPAGAKRDCPRWVKISKHDFKSLATRWFAHDWKADLPFWGEP
jgi:hypothetical protein